MDTKELNALKDRAYKTAIAHGFHEEERPDAFWLGLVMSEMGEAINADRIGWHAVTQVFDEDLVNMPFTDCFEVYIKNSVEDEIADIVIRLLDFAGVKGYELYVERDNFPDFHDALRTFKESGLPGLFFILMDSLSDAFDFDWEELRTRICDIIYIFGDYFGKMTGSDKGLWYFVEQKMKYNELQALIQRVKRNIKV